MFDTDESICISDSQFSHHSLPLETVLNEKITLISPNPSIPIREVDSKNIILVALNPIDGFRNDKNCYKFRNFLIELDSYERDLQIGYIKKLCIPYSALVWSGSKSTHVLISLDEPLSNEKIYRSVYKWMLNIASLSDQALGNPSRCIRLSGAIRPETGREQELIELKERISQKDLTDWLNKYEHLRPKAREKKEISDNGDYSRLSPWARGMLKNGIVFKNGRNQTWFGLAVDFALAGFSEEEAVKVLGRRFVEEHDFKEKEFLITIASAFKYVSEGK